MYTPFLIVVTPAGAPPFQAAALLPAETEDSKNGVSLRRLVEHLGVELYEADVICVAQLQEMLGLESRFELSGILKSHGVFFDYSPELKNFIYRSAIGSLLFVGLIGPRYRLTLRKL